MTAIIPRYALAEDARVFYNGKDEIRVRKGVWNYTEATLSLQGEAEPLKNAFIQIFEALNEGEAIDIEQIAEKHGLDTELKNSVLNVMAALKHQSYLKDAEEQSLGRIISCLFGNIYQATQPVAIRPLPALFFSDSPYSQKIAKQIADDMDYSIEIMDEKAFNDLCMADLTTKTDAIETLKESECLKIVSPYSAIIGVLEKPSVSFLRNLNRLLIEAEKPLVLGMIDGPFVTFLTINPPQTGCFECYENRIMARMENLAVYNSFVKSTKTALSEVKSSFTNPLLHALTSIAIAESFLISTIAFAKSSGRVVNVYLPVGEIQIQDLLRVPYCPACGHAAKLEMSEIFTSSKVIVNKLLNTINLEDSRT